MLNSSIATALTITVSSICPNKYYLSLITEANRPRIDGRKSLLLYLLPGYEFTKVKIKFLEFSHETANREIEDNKEWRHFATVSLQWLRCNGFLAMASLQLFFFLPFAYIYKQRHCLSWQRAIPGNIGLAPRTSQPMKKHY